VHFRSDEFHSSSNGKSSLLIAARSISDRSSLDGRIYVKGEGLNRSFVSICRPQDAQVNPLPRVAADTLRHVPQVAACDGEREESARSR